MWPIGDSFKNLITWLTVHSGGSGRRVGTESSKTLVLIDWVAGHSAFTWKDDSSSSRQSLQEWGSFTPVCKLMCHSYPERLLGQEKFSEHGTFTSQFYTHQCTTFWEKQNFLTRAFFSTDRLVVLLYKAKPGLSGEITKGSTSLSDRILQNHTYSFSLYPT